MSGGRQFILVVRIGLNFNEPSPTVAVDRMRLQPTVIDACPFSAIVSSVFEASNFVRSGSDESRHEPAGEAA